MNANLTLRAMTTASMLAAGLFLAAEGPATAGDRKLTPNEVAAHGPIPGDVTLYAKELACQQKLPTPGYASFLNAAEIADGQRSGVFPCATFTGSHDGPNQVFAFRSVDDYPGISYINNGEPGVIYIVGGEYPVPADPNMVGPYLAKADATTGKQIWRTYFDNLNVSDRWIGNSNLNIMENGRIAFSWSRYVALIDTDTGRILKTNTLPTGDADPHDVNFKHLTIAPDGTLILKDQTRPKGCTLPGTMAIIDCAQKGMPLQKSILVAVDPDTLEVLASLPLPEPAASPHIVAMHDGRIAIYVSFSTSLRRYYWDPKAKKLSADNDWIVRPLAPGQTVLTASSIIGDWIAVQLNGLFTDKAASSVAVAYIDDPKRMSVIYPFGKVLAKGEISFAPPKGTADSGTGMIYSADMGMQKVAGIKLDQASGKLKTKFVVDVTTNTFQPTIGPDDRRVLLLTNVDLPKGMSVLQAVMTVDKYAEQLTWRDALTGELLAESSFFEPLTINSLTTPGYGGRVYFPTAVGNGFYVLRVMPKRNGG